MAQRLIIPKTKKSQKPHLAEKKLSTEKRAISPEKQVRLDNMLIDAAAQGRTKRVERLLKVGADLNAMFDSDAPVLMYAVANGHAQACALLIGKGADVNIRSNSSSKTPLMSAAWNGYAKICKLLLENGADIAAKDRDGYTALHNAAICAHTKVCAMIIRKCAESGGDVNRLIAAKDRRGRTALHEAAIHGHTKTCVFLVNEYAKAGGKARELVAMADYAGDTAKYFAALNGHKEITQLFKVTPLLYDTLGVEASDSFLAQFRECVSS
jgi:ankyrin repeat protein